MRELWSRKSASVVVRTGRRSKLLSETALAGGVVALMLTAIPQNAIAQCTANGGGVVNCTGTFASDGNTTTNGAPSPSTSTFYLYNTPPTNITATIDNTAVITNDGLGFRQDGPAASGGSQM